jgi:hypothetical protein
MLRKGYFNTCEESNLVNCGQGKKKNADATLFSYSTQTSLEWCMKGSQTLPMTPWGFLNETTVIW